MNAHLIDELDRLADAVATGNATEHQVRRLSELLRDNPTAQDAYLDNVDMHAMLRWEHRDGDTASEYSDSIQPVVARTSKVRARATWGATLAGLAALVAIAATIALSYRWDSTDTPGVADESSFARITRSAGDHWTNERSVRIGQRVGARRLMLESGMVQITYDSGVTALLAGPADLEMTGPKHAYLREGRVLLRVPPSAIGYTIETAEANVIDLGTEFGVHVSGAVGTDVQVYEGEVIAELKTKRAGNGLVSHRLQGGQAMRLGNAPGDKPRELDFWPDRFVRYLPDPRDPHAPTKRRVSPYNKPLYDRVHIVPAPGEPTIDGKLDDWDLSGRFTSRCEPPYESFYHLTGAMMYDEEYLYIAAEVGDPFPMRSAVSPHVKRTLYGHGGCLAFRISTDRAMGWPVRGEGRGVTETRTLQPEDFNDKLSFLVLWYYEAEQTACLNIKHGMDHHSSRVNPPGYRGTYRKRDDGYGYTIEYAIPWTLLNAGNDPPQPGDVLGCTWLVHWAGSEGRQWKGQLIDVVNPDETGWNFQNAGTWGRAIYHAEGNLPPGTVRPLEHRDTKDE